MKLPFFQIALIFLSCQIFCNESSCKTQNTPCDPDEPHASTFEDKMTDAQLEEQDRDKMLERIHKYFGTLVTSSPYPGVRATYEGTELMSQLSSVNQDLQLLLQQKSIDSFLEEEHITSCKYPRLYISGAVEGTAFIQKDAQDSLKSDIELTDVELDFFSTLNNFSKAFFSIFYDRALNNISNNRVRNTRLKITSAFGLLGDLNKFPLYVTLGQAFVPFGQYTSFYSVSSALTKILFRTLAPELALGCYYKGIIASAFAYKGSAYTDSNNKNVNNYGFNLGFEFDYKLLDGKLAVSMQRNVADSIGMQVAFGDKNCNTSEKLAHVVPGIDFNAFFTIAESYNIIIEYIRTLRAFAPSDMAFSSDGTSFKGAQPSALNIEGAYTFEIAKHPAKFALGYTSSWEALGFNVPKYRINTVFGAYIFPQTLLSFEYTFSQLYSASNRAGGKYIRDCNGNPGYFINPNNLGSQQHTFSIDLYIYF